MRVLAVFLLMIVLAVTLYNTLEIRRLRGELQAVRVAAAAPRTVQPSEEARVKERLKEAGNHSARAQELMAQGDFEAARREMQKSVELMEKAAGSTADASLVAHIKQAAERTMHRLEEVISRVNPKPAPEAN